MVDRRVKATRGEDGRWELEGVAYVAEKPNVNGITYTRAALEDAFTRFMREEFRPVTIGCGVDPQLKDMVGEVMDWRVEGDIFIAVVRTIPLERVDVWLKAAGDQVAFAGSCVAPELTEDQRVEAIDRLISIGLVDPQEVGQLRPAPRYAGRELRTDYYGKGYVQDGGQGSGIAETPLSPGVEVEKVVKSEG